MRPNRTSSATGRQGATPGAPSPSFRPGRKPLPVISTDGPAQVGAERRNPAGALPTPTGGACGRPPSPAGFLPFDFAQGGLLRGLTPAPVEMTGRGGLTPAPAGKTGGIRGSGAGRPDRASKNFTYFFIFFLTIRFPSPISVPSTPEMRPERRAGGFPVRSRPPIPAPEMPPGGPSAASLSLDSSAKPGQAKNAPARVSRQTPPPNPLPQGEGAKRPYSERFPCFGTAVPAETSPLPSGGGG